MMCSVHFEYKKETSLTQTSWNIIPRFKNILFLLCLQNAMVIIYISLKSNAHTPELSNGLSQGINDVDCTRKTITTVFF